MELSTSHTVYNFFQFFKTKECIYLYNYIHILLHLIFIHKKQNEFYIKDYHQGKRT
jgi:hypothetical protein